jgi:hypothetical protein
LVAGFAAGDGFAGLGALADEAGLAELGAFADAEGLADDVALADAAGFADAAGLAGDARFAGAVFAPAATLGVGVGFAAELVACARVVVEPVFRVLLADERDERFLPPIGSTLPTRFAAPLAISPTLPASLPAVRPTLLTTLAGSGIRGALPSPPSVSGDPITVECRPRAYLIPSSGPARS